MLPQLLDTHPLPLKKKQQIIGKNQKWIKEILAGPIECATDCCLTERQPAAIHTENRTNWFGWRFLV